VIYQYDALGRRVARQDKKALRTEYTHDGLDVLQDRNSDGTITNYVNGFGIDNKLKVTSGSTSRYFLTDHLGSTMGMADSSGNIAESAIYDSFGRTISSTLTTRYQYTGREYDEYTGLMFYRARFYDPQIGRFISEDPIEFEGGRNWYVYAENSPLNYTDPLGLEVIILFYRKQGVLKVWDLDKGDWFERFNNPDLVIEAFSGDGDCKNQTSCDAEKDKGPIPLGRYAIDGGPNTGGAGWRKTSFRLFRRVRDSKDGEEFSHEYVPIQDRSDPSKTVPRGGFYIHTGNYSIGCVTVPVLKKDDYNKLSDMLKNTSKGTFINASDPKNPKKRKGSGYLFVY
jgi:RHS repeat-associated protein